MKLQEVFDQLATGELSQISIGGTKMGVIDETNYAKILNHVNLGLKDLYKRFAIRNGRITLLLQPNQEMYPLTSAFLVGNLKSREPTRHLLQSPGEVFKDDLLKVEKVMVPNGPELPINVGNNALSVITSTSTRLYVPLEIVNQGPEIPEEYRTTSLMLHYRAGHPHLSLPMGMFDPTKVEIQLPDSYLNALLLFIAARVHAPVGMAEEGRAANPWYSKYEAECSRLKGDNLEIDQVVDNYRLNRGGWV